MEEVKRFMRYGLPGLAVIVELSLALWISFPDLFTDYARKWLANAGFGSALAVFLATGGLGYLFAIIYYVFQDKFYNKLFYDYSLVLDWLKENGGREFTDIAGLDCFDGFDKRQQWELFNVVWHVSRGRYKSIEKVDGTVNRL